MDIIETGYIDTAELDHYIRRAIKRWEEIEANKWFDFLIETRQKSRDEFITKAIYDCSTDYCVNHPGPSLVISVDYDEIERTGKIEIEYEDSFSDGSRQKLIDILSDVIGTFDPSTAITKTKV